MADDFEHRWERVWYGLLVVALAVPSVAVLLARDEPAAERAVTAALAVAAGAWSALMLRRGAGARRRPLALLGWWLVTIALLLALIDREGAYTIAVYAVYPLAFMTLGWWAIPVVAAVTAASLAVLGDSAGPDLVYSTAAATVLAVAIGLFVDAFARQRAELAKALAANRRLQGELIDQARAAGVLEERARLAREIHDTLAQGLTSIVTQLEVAEQSLDAGRAAGAAERVDRAREIARESLRDVRRSMADLRPELLDRGSLPDALRQLVARTAEETGLDVRLELDGRFAELAPAAETTLLRCAQEALANARRHARARTVRVRLSRDGDGVQLNVADDGSGFDTGDPRGGVGLVGMAERADAVGGELDVRSTPGAGTTVSMRVPA